MFLHRYLLNFIRITAIVVFVSLVPILFLLEDSTGIVWTIIVPVVPLLFIVLGYSNWRKICPLAFFSILSQKLTWIEKKKVPKWFEYNLYH